MHELSHMQMFILRHNLFCEDSSIFRSFESSFHRNFVSLGDFSIDHANFLQKCFKFSKKDCEISFKISLKIRDKKGRIFDEIRSHYFCTVLYIQYDIFRKKIIPFEAVSQKNNFKEALDSINSGNWTIHR